jgi:hypothetical protein
MTERASTPPQQSTEGGIRSNRLADFARDAGIALAIGLFLAILAPLGTSELGWPGVFFYWVGLVYFGYLVAYGVRLVIDRWRRAWPFAVWLVVLALGVAVPMTAALALAGALLGSGFAPVSLIVGFFYVFVVSLGVSTFATFADRTARRREGSSEAMGSPSFLARLPARLAGGDLYAVEAEDHYLRVHTSRGDDLVLMRFSDALRELGAIDGLQVHRSWWVARAGVQKVQRQDGRVTLVLRNGRTVGVSRSNQGAIRRAGWG